MKVFWASAADQDRAEILEFIARDNPQAAMAMDERFTAAASRLVSHPHLGRTGQIPGTLELIAHEHYRMVYEVRDEAVWILAVVHTARAWPPPRP